MVALAVCGIVALAVGPAPAARRPPSAERVALAAITRLAGSGQLDAAEAGADRSAVARAARLADLLPPARAAPVASALAQVAAVAARLTAPRALALFGQLTVNDDWFARRGPPPAQTDVTDAEGVVYRYFPGAAFEFHPLANFTALNGDATSKNVAATTALAAALVARGIPADGGIGWEYYFDFAGGRAPWLSGFVQAVAAQAFARAARLLPDETSELMAEADAAYRTIPHGLLQYPSAGPWIRLYGFNHDVVLNAQLQTAISLASYATTSGNAQAGALATSMRDAAARALPRFDTGYWTYYSLAGDPSPLSYQTYVVQLLQTLARTDPRFAAAATRVAAYQTQPPQFRLAPGGVGEVEFWVSKPSSVRVSALGSVQRLAVDGGWHVVAWDPGHAGVYPVRLSATDWAGNSASGVALPIVRVVPPPPAPKRRPATRHAPVARAASALPPLLVGAGLDTPDQATLAGSDGFGAVRMTLVWPAGASTPSPGAIAALDRLPPHANLVLELYASPLPTDAPGRAALAAYAAAVAGQVPTLHDLILGPPPTGASAAADEAALAAVYDAVHQASPAVRVDGALAGNPAPGPTLAGLAAAYRASGRTAPLMDGLAFTPAPVGGAGWTVAGVPALVAALGSAFAGTAQAGSTLPLIVDDVAFASLIPQAKLALYPSSPAVTSGLAEAAQAAAYGSALAAAGCQPTVVAVILDRLVDSPAPGGQSGLYYADGTPKTSLAAVLQAVAERQGSDRGCASSPPPAPAPRPAAGATSPGGAPTAPPATPAPAPAPPPPTPSPPPSSSLAAPGALVFPASITTAGGPSVRVGCTRACLYLVTLQRGSDGAPVLATRGALGPGAHAAVTLPRRRIAAGSYRFAVWLVPEDEPDSLQVVRSPLLSAGSAV